MYKKERKGVEKMAKIGMSRKEYLDSLVNPDSPTGKWYKQHKKIQEQLQEKQQDKRTTKDVKEAAAAAIKEQLQSIFERK